MKLLNVQVEETLYEELFAGAKSLDSTGSKFVRDAIREKLARDVYGVVGVPGLLPVRQGIAAGYGGNTVNWRDDESYLPSPNNRGDMTQGEWMRRKKNLDKTV